MRILILNLQFPPDVNSTGQLMAQVGEGLVARGHEVSVITSFPHYEKFRIRDDYRGRLFERGSYRGMDVLRMWVYARGPKKNILRRLLNYLSFNVMATVAGLAERGRFDVILTPNGSFFTGLSSAVVGALRNVPFVYNIQDLYPEAAVRSGQLRSRVAVAGLQALAYVMYRLAARVTVIAPSFRRYLVTTKGVPSSKVSVIPNFVDTDFIRPLEKDNDFGRRHGLVDKFVVCHAGNVGWVYDLETLIEAAARLASFRDIVFLVVGDGVGRPVLERKASQRGVQNVRFLPFQPFEALPWMRAACDVHVALYRREQAWYSMPSKVYEIMASARPLLASAEPGTDVRTLVEETGCGLAVNPQDPDALVDAILRLYRDPATRAEMGRRGRAEAERAYSKDAVVAQYERLLRSVATRAD